MGKITDRLKSFAAVTAAALAALVLIAWPATAAANPVVITMHGGGYLMGNAAQMDATNRIFAEHGFVTVSPEYTLGDITDGWADVKAVAQSYSPHRHVYAYGVSAGGGYAAKLADRGMVDAAFGASPLVDLTGKWAAAGVYFDCTTTRCQERFSPDLRSPRSPMAALIPLEDTYVDAADYLDWAAREPLVSAITYHGQHCYPTTLGFEGDIGRVADWFARGYAGTGPAADHPELAVSAGSAASYLPDENFWFAGGS